MATNARSIHFQRLERECDYDDLPKLYELESWGWQVLFLNHAYVLLHSNSGRSYDGLQDAPAVIAKVKDILGEVEPAAPEEPQVPADLEAKGWEILTTDIGFRCENQAAGLRTLAWGTPEPAFEAARELQLAHDEGLVGTQKQTVVETGAETPDEVETVSEPAAEQEALRDPEPEAAPESPVEVSELEAEEQTAAGDDLSERYGAGAERMSLEKALEISRSAASEVETARRKYVEEEARALEDVPDTQAPAEAFLVHEIAIAQIRTDGGTQVRVRLDDHKIAEYAGLMEEGIVLPPIDLIYDGETYWLTDGFHRVNAAKKLDREFIDCNVTQGTHRDAILASLRANSTHGLHLTREEKRGAASRMLNDQEWSQWSDNVIARHLGVSQPFVSSIRRELVGSGPAVDRKGSDGRVINTENIGPKPKPAVADEERPQQSTDSRLPAHYREPELEAASAIEAPEETHTAEATIIPEQIAALDPAAVSDLWSKATITLTVQYMPGANGDRKVLLGACNDGDAPIFASTSESALGKLPRPMIEVLMKLADDLPRRAEAKAAPAAKPAAKQASKPKAPAKKASKATAKKPAARKSDKKATARA